MRWEADDSVVMMRDWNSVATGGGAAVMLNVSSGCLVVLTNTFQPSGVKSFLSTSGAVHLHFLSLPGSPTVTATLE